MQQYEDGPWHIKKKKKRKKPNHLVTYPKKLNNLDHQQTLNNKQTHILKKISILLAAIPSKSDQRTTEKYNRDSITLR